MYAIVETGGKQYKATPGDILQVEKLPGEKGTTVTLENVLFVSSDGGTKIGTPMVPNTTVTGEIVEQGRGEKILVFKKKRRKNYRRTRGHRQSYTKVKITAISGA